MAEDKKVISPQSVYTNYVQSIRDHKTYVMSVPSKNMIVYTNNHTMFTTFYVSECIKRDELVRENGQSASYDIGIYKSLHVATNRRAYQSQQQGYKCALLYKETPVNQDNPEYHTLVMTNSPEIQAELLPELLDGHCSTFNLRPHVGRPDKEVDSLAVEGCYGNNQLSPVTAETKGEMLSMQSRVLNGDLYDWIHDSSYQNVAPSIVKTDLPLTSVSFDK